MHRRTPTLRGVTSRVRPGTEVGAYARAAANGALGVSTLRKLLLLVGLLAGGIMVTLSARLGPADLDRNPGGAGSAAEAYEDAEEDSEGNEGGGALDDGKTVDLGLDFLNKVLDDTSPDLVGNLASKFSAVRRSPPPVEEEEDGGEGGEGEGANASGEDELEDDLEAVEKDLRSDRTGTKVANEPEADVDEGENQNDAGADSEEEELGDEAPEAALDGQVHKGKAPPDEEGETEGEDAGDAGKGEDDEGGDSPTRPGGKLKAGDYMRLAREASKDPEKRKDPETKKLLRQAGIDAGKLGSAVYLTSTLTLLRKKNDEEKKAAVTKIQDAGARASVGGVAAAKVPATQWLPTVKSRGGQNCGVCTNGTGGNFAKGLGMVIGGGAYNTVQNEKDGYVTIVGGRSNKAEGMYSTVSGGYGNLVSHDDATVVGGGSNKATQHAATVGGGNSNAAQGMGATAVGGANNVAMGASAVVAGGAFNKAAGDTAVIGGGEYNTASSGHATVVGGVLNSASHYYATVGGGMANSATFNYSTVCGGGYNVAGRPYATVAGGYNNTAFGEDAAVMGGASNTASGLAALVAGGDNNTASGKRSFASGHRSTASHSGAVVFGDATEQEVRSTRANQFTVQHADVRKPGGGMWVAPADRRSMAEVQTFTQGLAVVKQLTPVKYQYDTEGILGLGGAAGATLVGLSAQDLEGVEEAAFMVLSDKVTPSGAASKDKAEAHKAVDPSALTYMLINAVKELSTRVEALEKENARLRVR